MMVMMKLAVLVLVCAAVAQTRADAPEAASSEPAEVKEKVVLQKRGEIFHPLWTTFDGRSFSYFSSPMTWAEAEKLCRSIGANLASVRNHFENTKLLSLIRQKHGSYTETWIGGSDAQKNGVWFWSDGSNYQYTNWCPKEPNNLSGHQECLQMSHSDRHCWDDLQCWERRPFICVKKRC